MKSPTAVPSTIGGAFVILRSRWQVARNAFWRGGLLRKLPGLLLISLALLASYVLYRFSGWIVGAILVVARERPALLAPLGDLPRVIAAIPSIALTSALAPLLLSSISWTLATLYLARDLDMLLVSPVPRRSVFLARFVEGLLPIYVLLLVLIMPALAGYGLALGYGVLYGLLLIVTIILAPLLPMSLGMLLTMALVRVIPPQRIREIMAVLGGLAGFGMYIGMQMLGRAGSDFVSRDTAAQLIRLDIAWLPTAWAARALYGAGVGELVLLARYGVPFVLASLLSFGLALVLAEQLYHGGWTGLASVGAGKARRRARGQEDPFMAAGSPAMAILRKEIRTLPRDPQRLSQLLVPLAFTAFWVWQLMAGRGISDNVNLGLTGIVLFVCVLVGSNLGVTSLGREGRSYWLMRIAPLTPWPILRAKWLLAFLPFPILSTLATALLVILRQPPPGELLLGWTTVVMTGIGVSGIATGIGAAFPRFDWTQPQRMASFRAGCLGSLLYYAYVALMVFLTVGSARLATRWGPLVLVGGWTAAVILTAAALLLPLLFAASRMERMEL